MDKKCPEGQRWCPVKEQCIPDDEMDPRGKGRGQGKGPIGVPKKEQNIMSDSDKLVDEILNGNYKEVKVVEEAMDMVDIILDINIKEGSEYQEYFKGMLQKFGVKSPSELQGDKKKQFFAAVSKGWKGKKKVSETVNAIDHVPEDNSDELLTSIEDELGREEENRDQLEHKELTEKELIDRAYGEVLGEHADKIAEIALVYKAAASVEIDRKSEK
jgi:hypothetical protein